MFYFFCLQSFFGRTYNNLSSISECKNNGECVINKKSRTSCKACRLRKCLLVGMSKSGSRYGRRSNWFKIHCLLQDQNAAAAAAAVGHHPQHHHHNGSNRSSPLHHHQQHQPQHHQPPPPPSLAGFGAGSPLYPAGLVHPGHHFLTTDKFLQARLNGYGAAAALMTAAVQDDASCRRRAAAADAIISGHHLPHHRLHHHHHNNNNNSSNNNNNSIDRRHRHYDDGDEDDDDDCGGVDDERNDNNNDNDDDDSPKGGSRRRRRLSASDDSGGSSMHDDEDNGRGEHLRKMASPVLRHPHSPSTGTPATCRQLSSSPASSIGSAASDAKRIRLHSVSPSTATIGSSPVSGFHSPYYPLSVTRPGLTPFAGGLTLSMAAAGWHAAVAAGRTAAGGDLLLSSPAPGGVAIEQEYPIDLSLKTTAAKYNRSPPPTAIRSRHSSSDDPETAATATAFPPSPLDLTKRTAEVSFD